MKKDSQTVKKLRDAEGRISAINYFGNTGAKFEVIASQEDWEMLFDYHNEFSKEDPKGQMLFS